MLVFFYRYLLIRRDRKIHKRVRSECRKALRVDLLNTSFNEKPLKICTGD